MNATPDLTPLAPSTSEPTSVVARLEAPVTAAEIARAVAATAARRAALRPEELLRLNVDVSRAVSVVLSALPRVAAEVPDVARLPGFDGESLLELRALALAALDLHRTWRSRRVIVEDEEQAAQKAVIAEASTLRQVLTDVAELLAKWGPFAPNAVSALELGVGHVSLIDDLLGLTDLFRGHWRALEGHVPITIEQLDRAEAIISDLAAAVAPNARRTSRAEDEAAELDERRRAFTLLFRRYEQLRAGVAFLRVFEKDGAVLTPALYGTRPTKRPRAAAKAAPTTATAATTSGEPDATTPQAKPSPTQAPTQEPAETSEERKPNRKRRRPRARPRVFVFSPSVDESLDVPSETPPQPQERGRGGDTLEAPRRPQAHALE